MSPIPSVALLVAALAPPAAEDLVTPPMTDEAPAPGRRVRQVAPEYEGTEVHHALYLPVDWEPGGRYPVIVEFPGHEYRAGGGAATGKVEDANLGYGLTGGRGFLWVTLPYVKKGRKKNVVAWWGDRRATIDYCKVNLPRVCREFGGDPDRVFVCGFSRGSVACSYVGLADDEIASLWRGVLTSGWFDGQKPWDYPESDRESALVRLSRLDGRPVLVCGQQAGRLRDEYLADHLDLARFSFLDVRAGEIYDIPEGPVTHPHTDLWMHRESAYRRRARGWLDEALAASTAPRPAGISLGDVELVYTDDEIPIRYDGSLSTLRVDGAMRFFHSFGCRILTVADFDRNVDPFWQFRRSRHSWHEGTPDDPLRLHLGSATDEEIWDYAGHYQDQERRGLWILGIYRCPDGDLLGITHAEFQASALVEGRPAEASESPHCALGLGRSVDGGATWTYLGEIVRAADDRQNVGGGAYVVRGDWLYVYFSDVDGEEPVQCVARAPLDAVLEAAARGEVTTWHKYRDGQWDVEGLSGRPGSDVVPDFAELDLHGDATWCTALERYLLAVHAQGRGRLLLLSSPDGVAWSPEATLDQAGPEYSQVYPTFVDFDGPSADGHTVDDDFWVYFPRKGPHPDRDYMYRRRIRVEDLHETRARLHAVARDRE